MQRNASYQCTAPCRQRQRTKRQKDTDVCYSVQIPAPACNKKTRIRLRKPVTNWEKGKKQYAKWIETEADGFTRMWWKLLLGEGWFCGAIWLMQLIHHIGMHCCDGCSNLLGAVNTMAFTSPGKFWPVTSQVDGEKVQKSSKASETPKFVPSGTSFGGISLNHNRKTTKFPGHNHPKERC